jgi:hypothetical protein
MIDSSDQVPDWLDELVSAVADCFACMPRMIDSEHGKCPKGHWEIRIYPSMTEVYGQPMHPPASVLLTELLDLFDEVDELFWDEAGITFTGKVDEESIHVELLLKAPEGSVPTTKLDLTTSNWVELGAEEDLAPPSSEDPKLSN